MLAGHGVISSSMRRDSKDVAASHSQTAVAAAKTMRRHTRTLLLWQQRRCGVTLSICCCGSRDVGASHSQTAVVAAETLRRHTRRPLLQQQGRCGIRSLHLDRGGTGATPQVEPVESKVAAAIEEAAADSSAKNLRGTVEPALSRHRLRKQFLRAAPQFDGGARGHRNLLRRVIALQNGQHQSLSSSCLAASR